MVQVPQHFTPRPYQLEVLKAFDSGFRRICLCWTRQIGKDTLCWALCVREAVRKPGNYTYIFPFANQAKRAIWTKIMSDECEGIPLMDMLPKQLIKSQTKNPMHIELTNGSTIDFLGSDSDPERFRGVTPTGIIFSEFAFSDDIITAYKALEPAFRRKDMWVIVNSTPNGHNSFYDLFNGAVKSKQWFTSFKQSYYPGKDNFVYVHSQEEFKEKIREGLTTEEDLQREYGCNFDTQMQGSYYMDCIRVAREEDRIAPFLYDPSYLVHTFWDIGIDDATAVWFVQYVGNSVRFIDFYEKEGGVMYDHVRELKERGYEYGVHYVPHDAGHSRDTGRRIAETTADILSNLASEYNISDVVEIVDRPNSKIEGIQKVRMRFNRYFFDMSRCSVGLNRLELYKKKFNKSTLTYAKEPHHDINSHAADALRLEAITEGYCSSDSIYEINNSPTKAISSYNKKYF